MESNGPTKEDVVGADSGEDLPAWETGRLESLAPIAFKAAYRVMRNKDEAEDVAQGTLAAVMARPSRPDNSEAWVTTVATRLALKVIKRRQAGAEQLRTLSEEELPCGEQFVDQLVARLLLDEVLERLPLRQRVALELRFRFDLPQTQVAEVMQIGIESVKTHVERGRNKARALYEQLARDVPRHRRSLS